MGRGATISALLPPCAVFFSSYRSSSATFFCVGTSSTTSGDPGEQQRLPARDLRRTGLTERLAAVRDWNQALHAALVAHGAQRRAAPDPETAERLRALGYFDQ